MNYCLITAKKPGKTKEEAQNDKKQDLEKRLEDVKSQINANAPSNTKFIKKGNLFKYIFSFLLFMNYIWNLFKSSSIIVYCSNTFL